MIISKKEGSSRYFLLGPAPRTEAWRARVASWCPDTPRCFSCFRHTEGCKKISLRNLGILFSTYGKSAFSGSPAMKVRNIMCIVGKIKRYAANVANTANTKSRYPQFSLFICLPPLATKSFTTVPVASSCTMYRKMKSKNMNEFVISRMTKKGLPFSFSWYFRRPNDAFNDSIKKAKIFDSNKTATKIRIKIFPKSFPGAWAPSHVTFIVSRGMNSMSKFLKKLIQEA
mmetsp:Transcript_31336/g.51056  ORF Transcript_31336/g.51056 Transcript_31336/m.51056 type:complete len:228 (-) Transcript_31336:406-1089(-)